jgi:hypothetical protein
MKPTHVQVSAAIETLQAAGWTIAPPPNGHLRLLSVGEVAAVLSISTRRARDLAEQIPGSVRLPGNDIRVKESALQKWIDSMPLCPET